MKRTQIYLDEKQDERVERRARASGKTKSRVIRDALDAYLGTPRPQDEFERALEETSGALPDIDVPSREEWDRGYG